MLIINLSLVLVFYFLVFLVSIFFYYYLLPPSPYIISLLCSTFFFRYYSQFVDNLFSFFLYIYICKILLLPVIYVNCIQYSYNFSRISKDLPGCHKEICPRLGNFKIILFRFLLGRNHEECPFRLGILIMMICISKWKYLWYFFWWELKGGENHL